jgi:hypothetical protein
MRSSKLWLAFALIGAFVIAEAAGVAQPPGPGQGLSKGPVQSAPISVDDMVARVMAFDKNKDGKVTKDELPERMQDLIGRGDTNKDGALDADEIKKLATSLAPAPGVPRGIGVGGRGEFESTIGPGGGVRVGPGPIPGPGGIAGIAEIVDDLKLSGKKKDQALAAVKAHQENVRKLLDQSRADLLEKMQEILSEEELKDFKAALDRPRGATTVINVGPPGAPRPGDLDRRIEQLQKELDELRRQKR